MDGKQVSHGQESFQIGVKVFITKAERQPLSEQFNNLFVKNFPKSEFSENDLRKTFEVYGPLTSVKLDASMAFGFVSFEKCDDAAKALNSLNKEESGSTLYVAKCVKKEERLRTLKRMTLKFMKDLARNNLYFKGFPVDKPSAELT
jgi:RNA recognition motif-containing protein